MNDSRCKVLVLYGTRPEVIKMAPVIAALGRREDEVERVVCTTGQHRELLDQAQTMLGIRPDVDLALMRPEQSLNELAARAFAALDGVLERHRPDWLLVQGDTTTAMVGALAAFHRGVRVGHVEAGLRTGDLAEPFPEEANRRVIDVVAAALFVPTEHTYRQLLAEGTAAERVFLTGNTVVDALLRMAKRLPSRATGEGVLISIHRRENLGDRLQEIFAALRELAGSFPGVRFDYPVHRNPDVQRPAYRQLSDLPNLRLHEPFDYLELLARLKSASLVVTDSGGLQEEAPVFGVPVLVLRHKTERPEGVAAGVAKLIGTDRHRIVAEVSRLLTDDAAHARMARAVDLYGDGAAAERIVAVLLNEEFTPLTKREA